MIYRIVSEAEWDAARAAGEFAGSEHDRRDGFLHFSTAAQLAETASKHYTGRTDLLVLSVDPAALTAPLKWEKSRGGDLFPHLYGALSTSAVRSAKKLPPP
ncbi:MAG: DUF952 domain-containing protein [Elusimicrobia bacterium]|nr:DUF952 domain-containing protein [Elusimicrobiota bacterium]